MDQGFVQGDKYGSVCILLHADIQNDQGHLLKVLSFINMYFWLLYQNSCQFLNYIIIILINLVSSHLGKGVYWLQEFPGRILRITYVYYHTLKLFSTRMPLCDSYT